jgi:hypothetical protein
MASKNFSCATGLTSKHRLKPVPMPTISEYARARGVSHQYISKLVKKGMPLTTFEAADLWRDAYASSKASTNPTRIARIVDGGNNHDPSARHKPPTEVFKGKLTGVKLPSENTLEDAVTNARHAADEAWRLLHEAMIEGRASKIQVFLSIHNKAVEARFRAESAYREELERQRILIPLATAMEITRRAFDVILPRLKALPQNVGPRCTDPHTAIMVLEDESISILKAAQQAL